MVCITICMYSSTMVTAKLVTTLHHCMTLQHVKVIWISNSENIVRKVVLHISFPLLFSNCTDELVMGVCRRHCSKLFEDFVRFHNTILQFDNNIALQSIWRPLLSSLKSDYNCLWPSTLHFLGLVCWNTYNNCTDLQYVRYNSSLSASLTSGSAGVALLAPLASHRTAAQCACMITVYSFNVCLHVQVCVCK